MSILRLTHEPGERLLGDYEIVAVLGSGAFGTVYHCRDVAGGPDRAIKEMHIVDDPAAVDRALECFARETRYLSQLNHPCLPRTEAVVQPGPFRIDRTTGLPAAPGDPDPILVERRYFLLMDYHPGQTLESLVSVRRWEDFDAGATPLLPYVCDLADALGYLHDQGLVHRDVKPHNILIRKDGRAMLLDLGLLRDSSFVPGYGTVPMSASGRVGTPGYAPPDPLEQEHPTPASDQHALAMTVRRALTGVDPTRPDGLAELRRPLLELRGDLPHHVAGALDRAIRPAAEDRFSTMADFAAALREPPAPLALPPEPRWMVLSPEEIDAGPIAPGSLRDLTLVVRDSRPGVVPRGVARSNDDRLRILPAATHGSVVALHLLLRVPRKAAPGQVKTRLILTTDTEERVVPITYTVDPSVDGRGERPGCGWLALGLLRTC